MDIIVDIDGTLANIEHRLHFIRDRRQLGDTLTSKFKPNWDAFFDACDKDTPIVPVIFTVTALAETHRLFFCTGRPERVREATKHWLWVYIGVENYPIYMRKDGDYRPDDVVKREILSQIRNEGFNPTLAIDGRSRVVKMWREEGLICMQVAEGEY